MASDSFIQCRVSAATKEALRAAAQRQRMTESALVKRLIEFMLQMAGSTEQQVGLEEDPASRHARLYVRLTPEDWALLRSRAEARGMPSATYASNLLRAHLRHLSPLPKAELSALKQSVVQLSILGRHINQIAKVAHEGKTPGPAGTEFRAMLKICEALRDNTRALVQRNVTSWMTGHDEANR